MGFRMKEKLALVIMIALSSSVSSDEIKQLNPGDLTQVNTYVTCEAGSTDCMATSGVSYYF